MSLFSTSDEVVPLDIGFEPEAAVSGPALVQTDRVALLTFNAVRMKAGKRVSAGTGIIEIQRCSVTRFGYPNDEALGGPPLAKKGLGASGVFEVLRSSWVREKTEQNRVCFPRAPDSKQRHFVLTFHDSTFECIADDLRPTLSTEPFERILQRDLSESDSRECLTNPPLPMAGNRLLGYQRLASAMAGL